VAAVLWLGLVPTALATILYFRLIASAGPTFLSLVNYPMPLVAVAAGALVYGERPGLSALAGLALVLAALALARPTRGA
jgi:drug/metabolite transporter (DMT)-like permease